METEKQNNSENKKSENKIEAKIVNLFEDMSPHIHDVESYEKLTQPTYKPNNE
jgi:hypothetical protein